MNKVCNPLAPAGNIVFLKQLACIEFREYIEACQGVISCTESNEAQSCRL